MTQHSNRSKPARRSALWCIAILTVLVASPVLLAQENTNPVSLKVVDADLSMVVRLLTESSGANVVIGDGVTGSVTCTLTDVSLEDALTVITKYRGLSWTKENGVYVISRGLPAPAAAFAPVDSAPTEAPVASAPLDLNPVTVAAAPAPRSPSKVEKLPLRYRHPAEVIAILTQQGDPTMQLMAARMQEMGMGMPGVRQVFNNNAPLGINPGGGSLAQQASTAGFSNIFPGPAAGGAFNQFGGGDPMMGGIGMGGVGGIGGIGGGIGTGGIGGVGGGVGNQSGGVLMPQGIEGWHAYEKDNSLIVKGSDEAIAELEEIIRMIDIPEKQVRIEAEFLTVRSSDEDALGFSWQVSDGQTSMGADVTAAGNLTVTFARGNFQAAIQALKLQNRARTIIAPRVTTPNNVPASIGQSIVQWFTTTGTIVGPYGGATVAVPQVNQVQIGIQLFVVPRVNGDGSVTMIVQPQVQDINGFSVGPGGQQIPNVQTQFIQVPQIRVRDGETLVLGGLIRRANSRASQKLPFFSDLPLVGNLFRSKNNVDDDNELLIFVTPTVLDEDEGVGTMTGVTGGIAPVPVQAVQ